MLGGQGACTRVILVLRECIWNEPMVSLVLAAFDGTGSLGSPPRQGIYHSGSTLGNCLPFPCLSSSPDPQQSLECCLLGLLFNNIYLLGIDIISDCRVG